ncbi:MAG: peptide chain release factor N(5)-glutamine methyltransferase [Spirochaetes bacterium]|nr:peptide chain release factor N(5)-glutamine methyltransferase [Spirochaetota bacterium]
MPTYQELITHAAERFSEGTFSNIRLEIDILLAHAAGITRERLYASLRDSAGDDDAARFNTLCERRLNGEPSAYITGKKEFYGETYAVDPNVLIPRPETEELIELSLPRIPAGASVLDIGTGSGCIAITLKKILPSIKMNSIDISAGAIAVAKRNAQSILGADHGISFIIGDIFTVTPEPFDYIISNPPYVADGDINELEISVQREPHSALRGGPTGVEFIARLADNMNNILAKNGSFSLEIGDGQMQRIVALFTAKGYTVSQHADLSGKLRFVTGRTL